MADNVIRRIHALRQMNVAELRREWERLYGEPARSRNKDYLYHRLAWRIQELQHGGLSSHARQRIDKIASVSFARARALKLAQDAPRASETPRKSQRDLRLPAPGTVIVKAYKGQELRLVVHEDHFELDGQSFRSLSEAARHVTGAKWNGKLFFGLKRRNKPSRTLRRVPPTGGSK